MPISSFQPTTPEDMMPTSALSVSPISVQSIFDELVASDSVQTSDIEDLSVHNSTLGVHLNTEQIEEQPLGNQTIFLSPPPPPSDRWNRRLAYLRRDSGFSHEFNPTSSIDLRRASVIHPYSSNANFVYGQNCLYGKAVQTSTLMSLTECNSMTMLNFDVIYDDGGQYGSLYGIDNVVLNDGSVYCSGSKGPVNILTKYTGFIESGLKADVICSINKLVLKAPQHGFTAPCKEGLIFMSYKEIDVKATSKFDHFQKEDYDRYVKSKATLSDRDPVAWFTIERDRLSIVELNNRSTKYVLIKMLRSDHDTDNIDLQYVGYVGFSGARSFGSAKLC